MEPVTRTPGWKVDDVDEPSKKTPNLTTVHVRRRGPIRGRLVMPPGVSAEGISSKEKDSAPEQRATFFILVLGAMAMFVFPAASNHGYAIGISDDAWACDLWTGVILASDEADLPM